MGDTVAVALRRFSLGSLGKFGCLLGAVAAILPSLLCGLLGLASASMLLGWLESWIYGETVSSEVHAAVLSLREGSQGYDPVLQWDAVSAEWLRSQDARYDVVL